MDILFIDKYLSEENEKLRYDFLIHKLEEIYGKL